MADFAGTLIVDSHQAFIDALPTYTTGASSLTVVLDSLARHFPQLSSLKCNVESLDGVVHDLYRVLSAVQSHRGTLAAIHTLPDDVVTRIIRLYCRSDYSFFRGTLRWSRIMLVCRRWYNLITSDGFLWSFLSVRHRIRYGDRQIHIFDQLDLAGDWPVSMFDENLTQHDPQMLVYYSFQADRGVFSRLTSLRLDRFISSMMDAIILLVREHGPAQLSSLSLSGLDEPEMYVLDPAWVASLVHLRYLYLSDVDVALYCLPASLAELSLTAINGESLGEVELYECLARLGNLEHLEINRRVQAMLVLPVLNLPRLRKLSIAGPSWLISKVLKNFKMPVGVKLGVVVRRAVGVGFGDGISDMVIQPMRHLLSRSGAPRIRSIAINLYASYARPGQYTFTIDGLDYYGALAEDALFHTIDTRAPRHALHFSAITAKPKVQRQVIRRLFTSIMTDVQVIDVRNILEELGAPWWKTVLLSLPALQEVYINGEIELFRNFGEAMVSLVRTHPDTYPRLRGVWIQMFSEAHVLSMRRFGGQNRLVDSQRRLRNAELVQVVARGLKESGNPLEWIYCRTDFEYWPGIEATRELSSLVGEFRYDDDKVFTEEWS